MPARRSRTVLCAVLGLCLFCTLYPGSRTTGLPFLPTGASPADTAVKPVPNSANPGVLEEDPLRYRQVVAVSDVHGEYDNLLNLLMAARVIDSRHHWSAGATLLIVAGDSIDKGEKSLEVLDLWKELETEARAQQGKVDVLLGNHEAELLADPDGDKKAKALFKELKAHGQTVHDLVDLTTPHGQELRAMPVAVRVGDWLFCHSGWLPDMDWKAFEERARTLLQAGNYADDFFLGDNSILEKKTAPDGKTKWWESPQEVQSLERRLDRDGLYGVVFGHQPKAFGIEDNIGAFSKTDHRLIKIDSGMAPGKGDNDGAYPGHLLLIKTPAELKQHHTPQSFTSVWWDPVQKTGLQKGL